MSCEAPIAWPELVEYWAGDLAPSEALRLEEHLLGCATCTLESARVAAVVQALREFIPPVVSRGFADELHARGLRIEENAFLPGERQAVRFRKDLDVMIHRLAGLDLSDTIRVQISVRSEGTGQVMMEDANVPFDRVEGVLVACQWHFASMAHDVLLELRAVSASGAERCAVYLIPHVFE